MAIEIRNLTKQFGEVTALDQVSLSLEENKIYGLLGRNGAGKSTLLNLITNKIFPTAGEVTVDGEKGQENDHAQGKIFSMGEKNYYPDYMKVSDVFRCVKMFYPNFDLGYAKQLAEKFELRLNAKVKGLSTGYGSIFKLIAALASGAEYLFFDEPVLGLDANHRELFYKELVSYYSEHPCTIVISTHLIEEVADIVEQVVIIKSGKILLDQPTEDVLKMGYCVSGKAADVDVFCEGKKVLSMESLGGLKTACVLGKPQAVPPELETASMDLQKLFVQLTNA